jgi:hypothetical protein
MRRTQIYLDDDLWKVLHAQARSLGTSVSELVRQAVRERYFGRLEERKQAMRALVGIRRDRVRRPRPVRAEASARHAPGTIMVDSDVLIEMARGRDGRF